MHKGWRHRGGAADLFIVSRGEKVWSVAIATHRQHLLQNMFLAKNHVTSDDAMEDFTLTVLCNLPTKGVVGILENSLRWRRLSNLSFRTAHQQGYYSFA